MVFHDPDYAPDAFEVKISELLVATPEGSDALIDESVSEVLRLIREHLKMMWCSCPSSSRAAAFSGRSTPVPKRA